MGIKLGNGMSQGMTSVFDAGKTKRATISFFGALWRDLHGVCSTRPQGVGGILVLFRTYTG